MRILMTGSNGFIGRRLSDRLAAKGHHIVPFSQTHGHDLLAPHPFAEFLSTESYQALIQNAAPKACAKIDLVVHLAARSFVPDSWADPQGFWRTNVEGTQKVIDFCLDSGAALLHFSSYVYGVPQYLPVDENHPTFAFNPYAESKIAAEQRVFDACDKRGLFAIVVRPFNIYGPGQDRRFLIGQILEEWKTRQEVVVENLLPKRDYLFVADLISAVEVLVHRIKSCKSAEPVTNAQCEIHNIGSGRSYSVAEVIDTLERVVGRPIPRQARGLERPNEVHDIVASCRLTREKLWHPIYSLEDGLKRCLAEAHERDLHP